MRKKLFNDNIKNLVMILLGIFSASLGIQGFLLPNKFIDGGVTGISMLMANKFHNSLPLILIIINTPFVFLGINKINKQFAIKSAISIAGLALALSFLDIPPVTNDKLLSAVFGGFFLGAGIGFAVRGGAVLDGTEIMALIFSKKVGISVGDVILIVNVFIFSVGAIFLSVEIAMYSMLTYYAASRTVDFMIHGIEEFIGVTIISNCSEKIKTALVQDMGWGLTVYKGKRGLSAIDQDILFCTVSRLEIPQVKKVIEEIDANAFVVMHNIHDSSGGLIKTKLKKMIK